MAVDQPVVSGQGYTVTDVNGVCPGGLADFVGHTALTLKRDGRSYCFVGDGAEHSGIVRFHQKDSGPDDKDVRVWVVSDGGAGTFVAVPAAEF